MFNSSWATRRRGQRPCRRVASMPPGMTRLCFNTRVEASRTTTSSTFLYTTPTPSCESLRLWKNCTPLNVHSSWAVAGFATKRSLLPQTEGLGAIADHADVDLVFVFQEGRPDRSSSFDCEGPLSASDCPSASRRQQGRRCRRAVLPSPGSGLLRRQELAVRRFAIELSSSYVFIRSSIRNPWGCVLSPTLYSTL